LVQIFRHAVALLIQQTQPEGGIVVAKIDGFQIPAGGGTVVRTTRSYSSRFTHLAEVKHSARIAQIRCAAEHAHGIWITLGAAIAARVQGTQQNRRLRAAGVRSLSERFAGGFRVVIRYLIFSVLK
jgi:RNA 3'-terminal phosphate cyclase